MSEVQPGRQLHYVESLDSVRSAWASPGAADACALARMEAIVALAFGRDLVMQQSYVVDSLAAQTVIAEVGRAFANLDDRYWRHRERPVRLHLFRAESFVEALTAGLRRIAPLDEPPDPKAPPPFHSSLYPELHEKAGDKEFRRALDELDRHNPLVFANLVGQQRGELFEQTWQWFRRARSGESELVARATPLSTGPGVDECVRRLMAIEATEILDDRAGAVTAALRQLAAAADGAPEPFRHRSRLHGSWTWFHSGRTPEEIVGDDRIDGVREVVDTLYNRTIVESIGVASACYTTPVRHGSAAVGEAIAQAFALHGSAANRDPEAAPPLEVRFADRLPAENPLLDPHKSVDIFGRLLDARSDPRWLDRLDKLSALSTDESAARADLIHEHLDAIGVALAGFGGAELTVAGRVKIALSSGLAGVGAGAAALPGAFAVLDPTVIVTAGAITAAAAAALTPPSIGYLERWKRRRVADSARSAFGELIDAPAKGRQR